MNKIPTAEEFWKAAPNDPILALKAFAKLHVEAALEAASEQVRTKNVVTYPEGSYMNIVESVDKKSILSAYPLTNIK